MPQDVVLLLREILDDTLYVGEGEGEIRTYCWAQHSVTYSQFCFFYLYFVSCISNFGTNSAALHFLPVICCETTGNNIDKKYVRKCWVMLTKKRCWRIMSTSDSAKIKHYTSTLRNLRTKVSPTRALCPNRNLGKETKKQTVKHL